MNVTNARNYVFFCLKRIRIDKKKSAWKGIFHQCKHKQGTSLIYIEKFWRLNLVHDSSTDTHISIDH